MRQRCDLKGSRNDAVVATVSALALIVLYPMPESFTQDGTSPIASLRVCGRVRGRPGGWSLPVVWARGYSEDASRHLWRPSRSIHPPTAFSATVCIFRTWG